MMRYDVTWRRFSLILLCLVGGANAQRNYTVGELSLCELSSLELSGLGPDDPLEPCILVDVDPLSEMDGGLSDNNRSAVITMVQVTPSTCLNQRDGAHQGILALNSDNDGKGVAIGFNEDTFLKFRFVSLIAGNSANLGSQEYDRLHDQLLRSLLATYNAQYIVGTCSMAAALEKGPALDYKTVVLAQVGPPSFYTDDNPYNFGFHINSDTYPLPAVRELGFTVAENNQEPFEVPVKVIYRTKSEFFFSTCRSAIEALRANGFTNLDEFLYTHDEDSDGDGVVNQFDDKFLEGLADQVCPPGSGTVEDFHPAIFMCTLTEQDTILRRLRDNGCRPTSLWLTASTWGWANTNLDLVPYFQGGGQWHEAMSYSDRFYASGLDLLLETQKQTGYLGSYDLVVGYAIPVLYAQHLQAAYRVEDNPNPLADFADDSQRERLRRALIVLNVDTLFGPVSFDENQRNNGRGAAGTQWLPLVSELFENALVSPSEQAEARIVVPALSALPCDVGSYVNRSSWLEEESMLSSGCTLCPVDTFSSQPSKAYSCQSCPDGSSTEDLDGQEFCIARDEKFIPKGLIIFGYCVVGITWICSVACICWIVKFRSDPVVKIAQKEFLGLICFGAIITPSTIIALSFQAGTDEDTTIPSLGCTLAPYLYTVGWIFQYVSLSAKTYRLYRVMSNETGYRRIKITFFQTVRVLLVALFIDIAVVTIMTILTPLVYERSEVGTNIDEEKGLITITSAGQCVLDGDVSAFAYVGPIFCHHLILMFGTNYLLYKVRNIHDRYQEQKYFALASAVVFELFAIGLPVMISVQDSPSTTFAVLVGIINLDSLSMLGFIFLPKINFQNKGLMEGLGVVESIRKTTSKRAETREVLKKQSVYLPSTGPSQISQMLPSVVEADEADSDEMNDSSKRHNSYEMMNGSSKSHNSYEMNGSSKRHNIRGKNEVTEVFLDESHESPKPKATSYVSSLGSLGSLPNDSEAELLPPPRPPSPKAKLPSESVPLSTVSKSSKDSWCSINLSEVEPAEKSESFNLLPALVEEKSETSSTGRTFRSETTNRTFPSLNDKFTDAGSARSAESSRGDNSEGNHVARGSSHVESTNTVTATVSSPSPTMEEKDSDLEIPVKPISNPQGLVRRFQTYENYASSKKPTKGRDSWHSLTLSGFSGFESTYDNESGDEMEMETPLCAVEEAHNSSSASINSYATCNDNHMPHETNDFGLPDSSGHGEGSQTYEDGSAESQTTTSSLEQFESFDDEVRSGHFTDDTPVDREGKQTHENRSAEPQTDASEVQGTGIDFRPDNAKSMESAPTKEQAPALDAPALDPVSENSTNDGSRGKLKEGEKDKGSGTHDSHYFF